VRRVLAVIVAIFALVFVDAAAAKVAALFASTTPRPGDQV
jgi:hypothetical protein